MSESTRVRELLERFIDHHVRTGERLSVEELCGGAAELRAPLERGIERYLRVDRDLDGPAWRIEASTDPASHRDERASPPGERVPDRSGRDAVSLPSFEGFETVERLGGGGMGEVYKLRDRRLDRLVAAKVIRQDAFSEASFEEFLREAQALALFEDERIVRVHEFRPGSDPPVILMEYVEGFELGRVGPSLELSQRARIVAEACEAIHRAHRLGLQHRDLKPANIMLDATLRPKILDLGLSSRDPERGHLRGTPHYLAPEQLDPGRPLDPRVDVYALGVILYELLCGEVPYAGDTVPELVGLLQRGHPRLPAEIDPRVPEPLQAIALRAMERDPDDRYPSAREMALDLRRYLDGRAVLARPTYYSTALAKRLRPHLDEIGEWLRLKLIHPHEAERLRAQYRRLEAREDDWIIESRVLSWSQIALYLGAALLVFGGVLHFVATRLVDEPVGVIGSLLASGPLFAGLNVTGYLLYRREQKAVAVAFFLAGVLLLPIGILFVLLEGGVFPCPPEDASQLLRELDVSNRQLQLSTAVACLWAFVLAWRTRTTALSSVFTVLLTLTGVTLLGDLGLRTWIEEQRWDRIAFHLAPLVLLLGGLGHRLDRSRRAWFGRPAHVAAAALFVVVLELLALDGRMFAHLGISLAPLVGSDGDPVLLETLVAMIGNGLAIYLLGWALDRRGSDSMRVAGTLLLVVSPFAILEPLGYLVASATFSPRFDWLYLGMSLGIAFLSRFRQRRSFYFAGLLNTAGALWGITSRRDWWDRPGWGAVVLIVGLGVLAAGWLADRRERFGRV